MKKAYKCFTSSRIKITIRINVQNNAKYVTANHKAFVDFEGQ